MKKLITILAFIIISCSKDEEPITNPNNCPIIKDKLRVEQQFEGRVYSYYYFNLNNEDILVTQDIYDSFKAGDIYCGTLTEN